MTTSVKKRKHRRSVVAHLTCVIRNNPGVETNLLRAHLALLLAERGGDYLRPNEGDGPTEVPTNKEIIAMLRKSGRFRAKGKYNGPRGFCRGFHMPLHWWVKHRVRAAQLRWEGLAVVPKSSLNISVAVRRQLVDASYCKFIPDAGNAPGLA